MHDSEPIKTDRGTINGRFVTGLIVVDTDSRSIREEVLDFNSHSSFIPNLETSNISHQDTNNIEVDYKLNVKAPIISPSFHYNLHYTKQADGDLVWSLNHGDVKHTRGRWEFFELSDQRTLVSYSSWVNLNDLSWTIDTIIWAEPDLKKAIPISQTTLMVESFKRHFQSDEESDSHHKQSISETTPEIPTFVEKEDTIKEFAKFRELGTPIIIHPTQRVHSSDGVISFPFMTSLGLLDMPVEEAKNKITQFEKYPEFVRQLSSVNVKETGNGYLTDWYYDFGLFIMNVGVNVKIEHTWETTNSISFRAVDGDLKHIYGAVEFIPYNSDQTFVILTYSDYIHDNAPALVRLAKIIPRRQILAGSSVVGLGIEKLIDWVHQVN